MSGSRKLILAAVVVLLLGVPFVAQLTGPSTPSTPVQPPVPAQSPAPAQPPASPVYSVPSVQSAPVASSGVIEEAYRSHTSGVPVTGYGTVSRVLSDDNEGSRHQRFILRLASGHTILVAHNIDIAPRLNDLREGDQVSFSGMYEWNSKGGVVHWTHHDPSGRHTGGYLEHNGASYR